MIRLAEPTLGEEEFAAVRDVLSSGLLVQGSRVARFESALSEFVGASYVVAVSSGTAALHLSLAALTIGTGHAVFVPAFTFPAPANVIELQGARPVLVDVDSSTYCMTASRLKEALEQWSGPEQPRAVVATHEFGYPCEMERMVDVAEQNKLLLIEDAACALGTRASGRHVGTFGIAGCFSWHARKGITTGEGGAVVTASEELYRRLLLLRNHGIERARDGTADFVVPGFNYRMTEFQAALGRVQLSRFPEWLAQRKRLASLYQQSLTGVRGLRLPLDAEGHAWQTFMVVLPVGTSRCDTMTRLRAKGIETSLGAQALHMLSYYRARYGYAPEMYRVAAELYCRGLALPLSPTLREEQVAYVAQALREVLLP